jgi:hypothetical protein
MSNTEDLGFLGFGAPPINKTGFMPGGSTQTDIYKFETGSIVTNVAMSTKNSNGNVPVAFALSLFQDSNNTGVLDNGDRAVVISDGSSDVNNANESINTVLSRGTYFARARGFDSSSFSYAFKISRGLAGEANPLAASEIPLGTIDKDLTRRNQVNDQDTADNFALSLGKNSVLDIGVKELGNLSGDVNIRVIRDRDGDGIVDKNEIVSKGVSSLKGNVDTISGLRGAGDYILQVCQSQGDTKFQVKFDHSAV